MIPFKFSFPEFAFINNQEVINILNAISCLRSGFPVRLKAKKNNASSFFTSFDCIHPKSIEKQDVIAFSTKEFVKYNPEKYFTESSSELENGFLTLCKIAEIRPIGIEVEKCSINVPEVFIEDVAEYHDKVKYQISQIANAPVALCHAKNSHIYCFKSVFGGYEHYAICINNPFTSNIPLVRIHSSCYTGDLLASLRCDCRDQLQDSIKTISNHKEYDGGIVFYVMQEGRGIGLANKILAYNLQQKQGLDTVESNFAVGFSDDERSFVPVIEMLKYFNIKEVDLLTNNPKKKQDLESLGATVRKTVNTIFEPHSHNEEYLKVKAEKMGHKFS